jgi:hypothetical protein
MGAVVLSTAYRAFILKGLEQTAANFRLYFGLIHCDGNRKVLYVALSPQREKCRVRVTAAF